MTEKTKRILTIIGFVSFVLLAAFLIWIVFFNQNNNDGLNLNPGSGNQNNTSSGGKLDTSNGGRDPITPDFENENNSNNSNNDQNNIKDIINQNNNQDVGNIINNQNDQDKITDIPQKQSDIADGGIVSSNKVTNFPVSSISISGNNLVAFDKNTGSIYQIDKNGNKTPLTDTKFKGATDIIWAKDSSKAIIEFPDGSNITYDFDQKKQYILPKDWYDFSFQKDGEKIAFMIDSDNYKNRWLSVANFDGSSFNAIEPLGDNADKVIVSYSPNEQMIAMSRTGDPVGMYRQQVLLIGLNQENFKALEVEGRQFHPIWSPKGDKVVYDAYNEKTNFNPNLWIVNAKSDTVGTSHKSLGIQTWVSKCGFDANGSYLYCAVPRGPLPEGSALFPEALEEKGYYDDIYKINLSTGYSKMIAQLDRDVVIDSVVISSDDSTLYYKDKLTNSVYTLRLK